MPIGRELHPAFQPIRHVEHERVSVLGVPAADEVGQHELGVGINGRPRPHVASIVRRRLGGRYVLLLAVGEGPNLIDLHPLRLNAPNVLVVVGGARFASVHEQLRNRVLADVRRPHHRADRHALTEEVQDARTVGRGELVYGPPSI